MPTSIRVFFRFACICGLFMSLTLNAFVINDKIPIVNKARHLVKSPSYYEYYIDDDNIDNANYYDYPGREVKNKRYVGSKELRESVKGDLAEVIRDKTNLKSLNFNNFNLNNHFISEENNALGNEINDIYQNLIDKNKLFKSKNEVKGVENSYEVETKVTENSFDGVKGVANVDREVIHKGYNGSEPVMQVLKVHASATKDGKDGKDGSWKLQPIKSEFKVVSPNSKKNEKIKDNYLTRKGEDELEQMLIGDDYNVDTVNDYLNPHSNEKKNGVKNKNKDRNNLNSYNGNDIRVFKNSSPHREKREVISKQTHEKKSNKANVRRKIDKEENVNLLKKYIALQDAENHSLMRALDLASEIEFEQQEQKVVNKSKQAELLEEQMLQMRKALSNEKTLGEIKKIFEDNYKMKKLVLEKKLGQTREKQNQIKMRKNKLHRQQDFDYENDVFDEIVDGSENSVKNENKIGPKTNYEKEEMAERLKMIQEAKMFKNEQERSDYDDFINPEENEMSFENPYKRMSPYWSQHDNTNLNLEDVRKNEIMKEYMMKKVREYVLEKEEKAAKQEKLRQYLLMARPRDNDYSLPEKEDEVEGGDDFYSVATDISPDYSLEPVYETRSLSEYKRKQETCSTAMMDNCKLPRMRGLILDTDAIGLCDLHQLCFKCGSAHGLSANDCHHIFFRQVKSYCEGNKTCMKQAEVLFVNMLEGSSFQINSQPLCFQSCIRDKLSVA